MTARRKARKIGSARVTLPAVMFALIWHDHLISAAPVSAQNLVKTPPSNAALSREKLKKIDAFFKPPPGSIGEIKWDGASGTYFVVDPERDMFFVLLEDAPVQRGNVQRILKQIIYDCFED